MRIIGQEAMADMLGVSAKTVGEWQEQGLPVAKRGGPGIPSEYESAAVIDWFVRRELARANAERPRDRLHRAQAELAELNLRERRGELAPAAEIARMLGAAVVDAREFLLGESPRLAVLLDGLDRPGRESLLAKTFDEFLRRLAAWRPGGE